MAGQRWITARSIIPSPPLWRQSIAPRRIGWVLWLLALLVGLPTATAGAATDQHHAGVVVRYPDGSLTYAYVPFSEEEISGIELLRRTEIPLVTIGFGGLGEGVCSLAGEGCGATECRKRVCQGPRPADPFWHYFRLESSGAWTPFLRGASASTVADGDVDGWSWTGGEPGLPATRLEEIAALVGAEPNGSGDVDGSVLVRTIVPDGVVPSPPEARQGWRTYAGALALLLIGGAGAVFGPRRQRVLRQAPP